MVAAHRHGWWLWLLVPLLGCGKSSRSPAGDPAGGGGESSPGSGGIADDDTVTPARPSGGRGGLVHGGSGGSGGKSGKGGALPMGGTDEGGAPASVCMGGVTFADPDVEAAVRAATENPNLPIEAEALATPFFPGMHIANASTLAGLECIPALEGLLVTQSEELTELTPLSNSKKLNDLALESTGLHDLKGLGGQPIMNLRLRDSPIESLSELANLPALAYLTLLNIDATDLSPLAGLGNLRDIHIEQSDLTDLAPLATVQALYSFRAYQTKVANPAPLAQLPGLAVLDLSYSQLTSQADFSGFPALEYLDISGNPLGALPDLSGAPALRTVVAMNAGLVTIDIAPGTTIDSLDLRGNALGDVSGVALATNLAFLHIEGTSEKPLGATAHLDAVGSLSHLAWLELGYAEGQALGFMANLPELSVLTLENTKSIASAQLAAAASLAEVRFIGCTFDSPAFLASLDQLMILTLTNTNISDLTPLVQNAAFANGASLDYDGSVSCAGQAANLQTLRDRGVSLYGPCEDQ